MEIGELIEIINNYKLPIDKKIRVGIAIFRPGSLGGTPVTNVKSVDLKELEEVQSAHFGFDWDSKKFIIYPENDLTVLTREDVNAIKESIKQSQSVHTEQVIRKYKKEADELKTFIKTLNTSQMSQEQQDYIAKCLKN